MFAYLNRRLNFTLHAIIHTAGKSLHGWFAAPRSKVVEERLKAALFALGSRWPAATVHLAAG